MGSRQRDAKKLVDEAAREEALRREIERDRRERTRIEQTRETTAKYKLLQQQLAEAERRADFLAALPSERETRLFDKLTQGKGGDSTGILCLSDWHVGERVDPAVVNGLNSFDETTAEQRITKTFQKFVELFERLRAFAAIDDLVVWLGGDLMTGYIHEDLRQSNTMAPNEEALFCQDMVCTGLDTLLADRRTKRIRVVTNHGNHGRSTPEKLVGVSHKNSFEWGLYHSIARTYRGNNRIAFKVENGIHNWCDVQGHAVRFHHGDHIRYAGGVGGITIPVEKKLAAWNKARRADLDIFGHYHQFTDHWRWVCNGCLIGISAYGVAIGAEPQPPTQSLIVVSREFGKVMAIPVFCG